jgi:hypothetical protein
MLALHPEGASGPVRVGADGEIRELCSGDRYMFGLSRLGRPKSAESTAEGQDACRRSGERFSTSTASGHYAPLIRLSWSAHSRSRSTNFWILPVEVFGSGPNSIASGHL